MANEKIINLEFSEVMGERFGRYSKYIIQDRALPDVRDGLKPVQRRIIYAMHYEKNLPEKPYRKSAKTVGTVIGNFHPHGDTSVYDALVRMSQTWKLRYPLIEMHGNNGSIDGDSPAAMRYTEARLDKHATPMLNDIEKDCVDWQYNFDDSMLEPTVFPSLMPTLLINGSSGISSGYATNMPPHNLTDVINLITSYIKKPSMKIDEMIDILKAPDFPTGGIISNLEGLQDAYKTGKGRIFITSKYEVTPKKILITEIPYEVNKSDLVRKIDEIRFNKKIDGIKQVIDESGRDGIAIGIYLNNNVNPQLIEKYLLKHTPMQVSYSFNMTAIADRKPVCLSLDKIVKHYVEFQKEVYTKKIEFILARYYERLHILEGLIKAMSIVEELIKLIRSSKGKADSKEKIMEKWDFSDKQAEAIVTLQLYRLSNTDVKQFIDEATKLKTEAEKCELLLSSEARLLTYIRKDIEKLQKQFGDERRTEIAENVIDLNFNAEDLIVEEDVYLTILSGGYYKKSSPLSYAKSNLSDLKLPLGEIVVSSTKTSTKATVLAVTNLGNFGLIPIHKFKDSRWAAEFEAFNSYVPLAPGEKIINSVIIDEFDEEQFVILTTKNGKIKRAKLSDFKITRISKSAMAIKLASDDELVSFFTTNVNVVIISITNAGYGLKYLCSEIPCTGLKSAGVKAMSLNDGEVISSALAIDKDKIITFATKNSKLGRINTEDIALSSRGRKGQLILNHIKSNPDELIKIIDSEYLALSSIGAHKIVKATDLPIYDTPIKGKLIFESIEIISGLKSNKL